MSTWANLTQWLSDHYWSKGAGRAYWESVAEQADLLAERFREALRVRFPRVAPEDALGELAYARNLDGGGLTAEQLRTYLRDPWALWRFAGTRKRILEDLALLGLSDCEIVTWRDLADQGIPQAFGGDTSCWFLRIKRPNPWTSAAKWDSGVQWDQQGLFWDASNHDPILWAAIRRTVERWKPAASSCRFVEIVLRVDAFGNALEVARAPIHEWWEYDGQGNAPDYYNGGF